MKKTTISLLTLFVATGLLCGCENNKEEIHQHVFKDTWTQTETHHWHDASCEHHEYTKDLGEHTFDANNKCTVCGYQIVIPPVPTTLEITSQPKSVKIDNGSGLSLSVGVNNPDLVKSYQWYVANYYEGAILYENKLTGTKAYKDTYSLPAYYGKSTLTHCFSCEITAKDGTVLKSDWAIVEINPGKDDISYATLGDYAILPGATLNLIDTPYGTGSISLNADGDHFIFKDVMFSNANYDTNFAALAFSMSLTNPQKTNYIFEFQGVNHFENHYWEDDAYAGGSCFLINAFELGGRSVNAKFTGSGTLSFYGGSYAIISNFMNVVQDIDMTISGQPYRYNGGFYVNNADYTLEGNKTLNACLNARVIYINGYGNVRFNKYSNYIANLGVACGGNMASVSGITTDMGDIVIDTAFIDIKILLNAKRELEELIYTKTWAFEAFENIAINDSTVNFSVLEYNNEFIEEPEGFASSVTAGAFSADNVNIEGSLVNVNINGKHIMQARAFNCDNCSLIESKVNLDVRALGSAGGICCYTTDGSEANFSARNSDVFINLEMYGLGQEDYKSIPPYMNGGIYASKIDLVSDSENKIVINTNGVQTISLKTGHTDHGMIHPHSGYDKKLINFDNAIITSTKAFVHNEDSYSSAGQEKIVIYESLYELIDDNYVLLDNVVVTYSAH